MIWSDPQEFFTYHYNIWDTKYAIQRLQQPFLTTYEIFPEGPLDFSGLSSVTCKEDEDHSSFAKIIILNRKCSLVVEIYVEVKMKWWIKVSEIFRFSDVSVQIALKIPDRDIRHEYCEMLYLRLLPLLNCTLKQIWGINVSSSFVQKFYPKH